MSNLKELFEERSKIIKDLKYLFDTQSDDYNHLLKRLLEINAKIEEINKQLRNHEIHP